MIKISLQLRQLIFFLLICFAPAIGAHKYKMELALASLFRDEADYLKEWIEYHRMQGVEHFYLYNNLSQDHYQEVLQPYIQSGLVDLIEIPYEATGENDFNQMQINAYNDALNRTRGVSKWLAIIDTDEYLVPVKENNIIKFLKRYEVDRTYGGICCKWVFFGTSHIEKVASNELMIERLILNGGVSGGATLSNVWNSGAYKSIVRPDKVASCVSPHYCTYKTGYAHNMAGYELIQINHYWTRDEYFLRNYKVPRRAFWGFPAETTLGWANAMNQDTPFSYPILKYVPQLKKAMNLD